MRLIDRLVSRLAPGCTCAHRHGVRCRDPTGPHLPTYSATEGAGLAGPVRALQLERDGTNIKVFELMAPLVDWPFSAGVVSDRRSRRAAAIGELLEGRQRDVFELAPASPRRLRRASRASDAALRFVNAATGG